MDFDWQNVFDFIPQFDHQQVKTNADQTTTPVLENDQTQLSFYESSYDAVKIPQSYTSDGYGFPVYSTLEDFQDISTTGSYIDLTTPEYQYSEFDQSSIDLTAFQNELIMTQVPCANVEAYLDNSMVYTEVPENQFVPQEPAPAPAEFPFPIKFEVVGYVNDDVLNSLSAPSKEKATARKKYLKKFTSEWSCESCGRSFRSKGGLKQHNIQIHSGPKPHPCSICGKKFRDFDTMKQHSQRHLMKDKPFKCESCPKQFMRYSDLARHFNLHHWKTLHNCPLCEKPFDRADHLTNHLMSHENGTVKKYKVRNLNQTVC